MKKNAAIHVHIPMYVKKKIYIYMYIYTHMYPYMGAVHVNPFYRALIIMFCEGGLFILVFFEQA